MFKDTFTYPITIETVIGGTVVLIADGPRNSLKDTGCEISGFQGVVCILLTSPQASVDLYDPGDWWVSKAKSANLTLTSPIYIYKKLKEI